MTQSSETRSSTATSKGNSAVSSSPVGRSSSESLHPRFVASRGRRNWRVFNLLINTSGTVVRRTTPGLGSAVPTGEARVKRNENLQTPEEACKTGGFVVASVHEH